jgi:transcriptional regulator with XRE-family HTH domain
MDPTLTTGTPEAAAGAVLRKARLRQGLTCRGLAVILGCDHSELSRIERGRTTTLARYREIAQALGLKVTVRFRSDTKRAA